MTDIVQTPTEAASAEQPAPIVRSPLQLIAEVDAAVQHARAVVADLSRGLETAPSTTAPDTGGTVSPAPGPRKPLVVAVHPVASNASGPVRWAEFGGLVACAPNFAHVTYADTGTLRVIQLAQIVCAWFAGCDRRAAFVRSHPVLGLVPICVECDAKVHRLGGGRGTAPSLAAGDRRVCGCEVEAEHLDGCVLGKAFTAAWRGLGEAASDTHPLTSALGALTYSGLLTPNAGSPATVMRILRRLTHDLFEAGLLTAPPTPAAADPVVHTYGLDDVWSPGGAQ